MLLAEHQWKTHNKTSRIETNKVRKIFLILKTEAVRKILKGRKERYRSVL